MTFLKKQVASLCLAKWLALLFFIYLNLPELKSQPEIENKLKLRINQASSDSERIVRLGQLSQYYYANKDFTKGDSLIEKQIMLAETTLRQNLVLMAYFGNAAYQSPGVATKDRSKSTTSYILR